MPVVETREGRVDPSLLAGTETGFLAGAETGISVAGDQSPMDWAAVAAGAVVASGIAFVFTTFGAALGMSLVSPYAGDGSVIVAVVSVGLWMLWTTISSFMAGGYIAGRLRRRMVGASEHEVAVRDGIHGLVVWGLAILLGAVVLGSSLEADVTSDATSDVPAEIARRYSILSAFVTAAALMVAGAAAYWAAGAGGRHRDESQEFSGFGPWH